MATNPDNAVGTNAAYGGRTSVNAFNDIATAYSRGILSGWACVPNSGLTVSLGGDGTNRDVAIAEDNAGNKTSINNISGSPIDITLSAAPASNSRIDAIVAYVDNPPNGTSTIVDNPEACGIIAVTGTVSASPTPPTENQIRTAITADGASGTTAYYVVLANITVVNGTTDIIAGDIVAGSSATLSSSSIDDDSITSDKIDFTTFRGGNMPVATKTIHLPYFSASSYIYLSRIGNIVFAICNSTTSSLASLDSVTVAETMPNGFRPVTGTSGRFLMNSVAGGTESNIGLAIATDGSIVMCNQSPISLATRFYGQGCWITEDNWPS